MWNSGGILEKQGAGKNNKTASCLSKIMRYEAVFLFFLT